MVKLKRRLLAAEIFGKIKAGDFITRSPAFSITTWQMFG